ncbi:transposase [Paraburkholderia heleia]|uniref:transposase n=1 Tax=Paraburkholderia heleia TaxID=634127 RepID=UPI002AB78FBD|nr:transposase [Paraburkholderia heleia]
MVNSFLELSNVQWSSVVKLLPESLPKRNPRGRPTVCLRSALNGVLWVLTNDSPWAHLPARYPVYQTCHRYFLGWYQKGVLLPVLVELFGNEGTELHRLVEARMRPARAGKTRIPPQSPQPPFVVRVGT